jgi:hypothetical protein
MRCRIGVAGKTLVFAATLAASVVAAVAWASLAGASPYAAGRPSGARGCDVTVKAMDGSKVAINRYMQEDMRFAPGTITVKSGCMLTFQYGSADQTDPHTLSIVTQADLPKTIEQMENCKICTQIAAKHVKDPNQPPGPTNPVLHWIVNAGAPGLDAPGDSIAILEGPGAPAGHKSVSVQVTAPAGTTLYYLCAVHPWMQGMVKVT